MGKVDTTSIWLEKTFEETLSLLEEAEHYHAHRFKQQVKHLVPFDRLELTRESLRVTSRLSHMIAWLMNEKAILNKEITRKEYIEANIPLADESVCVTTGETELNGCPKALESLMNRSWSLFMRASRLERSLRQ